MPSNEEKFCPYSSSLQSQRILLGHARQAPQTTQKVRHMRCMPGLHLTEGASVLHLECLAKKVCTFDNTR